MFQSTYQKFAQSAGLTAFVLLAVAACAGSGGSSSTGPQASTFKPGYMKVGLSQENFSSPQGGIISVRARKYTFSDGDMKDIAMGVTTDSPAGQALKAIGETKYVATDFCAGFSADKPGVCDYIAVMLYRGQSGKNETRSYLFKPNAQGEYGFVCSRDLAYADANVAFSALKAECDPDQTPAPSQTPEATATPTATP
jgi:hypothetical protein